MREFEVEWDEEKNRRNVRDHGVSFWEASDVFDDPFVITITDKEHSRGEARFIDLGISRKNRCLVVVYTWRGPRTLRIISARKADAVEKKNYAERRI